MVFPNAKTNINKNANFPEPELKVRGTPSGYLDNVSVTWKRSYETSNTQLGENTQIEMDMFSGVLEWAKTELQDVCFFMSKACD